MIEGRKDRAAAWKINAELVQRDWRADSARVHANFSEETVRADFRDMVRIVVHGRLLMTMMPMLVHLDLYEKVLERLCHATSTPTPETTR